MGQRLRQIDKEGSIEPLREAIASIQARKVWKPGDAMAYAVLINGAMIDLALWIANAPDSSARSQAASHALISLIEGLAI